MVKKKNLWKKTKAGFKKSAAKTRKRIGKAQEKVTKFRDKMEKSGVVDMGLNFSEAVLGRPEDYDNMCGFGAEPQKRKKKSAHPFDLGY